MRKNSIIIDACVFLKLFFDEEGSKDAREFLENIVVSGNTQIIVPSLFWYEVVVQISKTDVSLENVFECFEMYKSVCLSVAELDLQTSQKAKEITKKGHEKSGYPSFYDSVYHALAIQNNCDFITADHPHFIKTKKLGNIKMLSDVISHEENE